MGEVLFDMSQALGGGRECVIARELTKVIWRGIAIAHFAALSLVQVLMLSILTILGSRRVHPRSIRTIGLQLLSTPASGAQGPSSSSMLF